MSNPSFQAFGDELTKIALLRQIGRGLRTAVSEGWHGLPGQAKHTWLGKGKQITPDMGRGGRIWENVTSLGGATKYLPVGEKSLMALGTGLSAREAMRPVDRMGMERSRAERITGLAGETVGGMVGTSAALRTGLGKKHPFLSMLIGGGVGASMGRKAVTTPWRAGRERAQRQALAQQPHYSMMPGDVQ